MKQYNLHLEGLDCANCAAKFERDINKINGVEEATISFMKGKLRLQCEESEYARIIEEVKKIVASEDVVVVEEEQDHHECCGHHHEEHEHEHGCCCGHDYEEHHHDGCCGHDHEERHHDHDHENGCCCGHNHEHSHEHEHEHGCCGHNHEEHHHEGGCCCGHDHGEREAYVVCDGDVEHVLYVEGLDCANCAAKIERKICAVEGVKDCRLNFMNGKCVYVTDRSMRDLSAVIEDVIKREESDVVIRKEKVEETSNVDYSLWTLIAGALFFVGGLFVSGQMKDVLMLVAYSILGYKVLFKAVLNIGKGKIFDENFLMAIATLAALYLQDFSEAAGVMLFYQIGEYFQEKAVASSRKSIGALMDIRPDVARVLRNGSFVEVDPSGVVIGEVVQVKPGERIPLDGVVVKGSSSLNMASLTGESRPVDVDVNSSVVSGSLNESGLLEIQVSKLYGDSTVAKILDLVENADERRAKSEQFITKFARWYTPSVVVAAVIVALVVGFFGSGFEDGIYRACTFLVISCPCALVISIPLGFFAGIGGLSKQGILVKGASLVEGLKDVETVVFDKTGTLTSGVFHISDVFMKDGISRQELIDYASIAEHSSNHPIGLGIKKESSIVVEEELLSEMKEIPGKGLSCLYDGDALLVGNKALMKDAGIEVFDEVVGTIVHVSKNGSYCGYIVLEDTLKEDAVEAIALLKGMKKEVVLVSGDHKKLVQKAGEKLGVDRYYGECLPQDKVSIVKELCSLKKTAFVGDGVNDAPVIATSDLGFAMGALGSDAAIEAADVVLMKDRVSDVSRAMKASKRIVGVVNQNIYFALIVKFAILILGALGYANMWLAIFADTGVAFICVLNAMRLLRVE